MKLFISFTSQFKVCLEDGINKKKRDGRVDWIGFYFIAIKRAGHTHHSAIAIPTATGAAGRFFING